MLGSVLFLTEVKPASLYLFMAGSTFMWVGSVGGALAKERRAHEARRQ